MRGRLVLRQSDGFVFGGPCRFHVLPPVVRITPTASISVNAALDLNETHAAGGRPQMSGSSELRWPIFRAQSIAGGSAAIRGPPARPWIPIGLFGLFGDGFRDLLQDEGQLVIHRMGSAIGDGLRSRLR